jgi:hypothetical protein
MNISRITLVGVDTAWNFLFWEGAACRMGVGNRVQRMGHMPSRPSSASLMFVTSLIHLHSLNVHKCVGLLYNDTD